MRNLSQEEIKSRADAMKHAVMQVIRPVCERYPCIRYAILFGSRARGDYDSMSDTDILLAFHDGQTPGSHESVHIGDELESALGTSVDLLTLGPHLGTIGHVIAREGVCVYVSARE